MDIQKLTNPSFAPMLKAKRDAGKDKSDPKAETTAKLTKNILNRAVGQFGKNLHFFENAPNFVRKGARLLDISTPSLKNSGDKVELAKGVIRNLFTASVKLGVFIAGAVALKDVFMFGEIGALIDVGLGALSLTGILASGAMLARKWGFSARTQLAFGDAMVASISGITPITGMIVGGAGFAKDNIEMASAFSEFGGSGGKFITALARRARVVNTQAFDRAMTDADSEKLAKTIKKKFRFLGVRAVEITPKEEGLWQVSIELKDSNNLIAKDKIETDFGTLLEGETVYSPAQLGYEICSTLTEQLAEKPNLEALEAAFNEMEDKF